MKLAIFVTLSCISVILLYSVSNFLEIHISDSGDEVITINPIIGLPFIGAGGLALFYYLYCTFLIMQRATAVLKQKSRIFFVGLFVANFSFSSWLLIDVYFPGWAFTLIGVGSFLMVYAYAREPKLLFILPFTALRLTVLETVGGIPLFTHTWNRQGDLADEDLFSSLLQGISIIARQSLKRGDVQEIRVADAIMIVYRNPAYPVAFVLVTTRPRGPCETV